MGTLPFGYVTNRGYQFAIILEPTKASVMGFLPIGPGHPKQPKALTTRKEVFTDTISGDTLRLPYPSPSLPHPFGSTILFNGRSWTAISQLDEIGTGEST